MTHNTSCARAKLPGCECACGGARHGCQGALEIADGDEPGVRAHVADRERDWFAPPGRVTRAQAGIGCAKADVVAWLHRDAALRLAVRAAQEKAFDELAGARDRGLVLRGLGDQLGPGAMAEFQEWARRTHFWCELLAQVAHVLAEYERLQDRMLDAARKLLLRWAAQGHPLADHLLGDRAVETAVEASWRYLLESLSATSGIGLRALCLGGDTAPLIWTVRVIAVLMCPDAAQHRAVRIHCWQPITRHGPAMVRAEVGARLAELFPADVPAPFPNLDDAPATNALPPVMGTIWGWPPPM